MKVAKSSITVYPSRLMSPNGVRAAVHEQGNILPKAYQQGCYFCGDVANALFHRLTVIKKVSESLGLLGLGEANTLPCSCCRYENN